MSDKKSFKPQHEIKTITTDMLQALADLGYPSDIRRAMSFEDANTAIAGNIKYTKEKAEPAPREEHKPEPKPTKIPEYQGDPIHKAAYDLDIEKLKELVTDQKSADGKDKDLNTLLHLAVLMAFQDFHKARKVIEFLKSKSANIFLRNQDNYTALEIAEQRSLNAPQYLDIVGILKN
jgi:ankyrin repeat protein